MTNEEIREVIGSDIKIRHTNRGVVIVYDRAIAWRVSRDRHSGKLISSLELVKGNSLVIARADECEII